MELRPCQQPLPPFWYAGSALHASERGMNFVGGERVPLAGVRELMEQYVAAFKQSQSKSFAEPRRAAVWCHQACLCGRERRRQPASGRASAYASYRTHFLKPLPGGPSGSGGDSAARPKSTWTPRLRAGHWSLARQRRYGSTCSIIAAETGANYAPSARSTGAISATRKPVVRSSCSRAKPCLAVP